ncbi:MAG TPA: HAD-IIA family hydrolase [Kofleriaceae bacterium]|nr:HAD-IIA family hydrolase [Kofleriaceae bacterium]
MAQADGAGARRRSGTKSYLIDMDGVLVHGRKPIAGAAEFLAHLRDAGSKYLVLTNNSMYTPGDLAHRLRRAGIETSPDHIFTSAMATAAFLRSQCPSGGAAFVIGESGLTEAMHDAGFVISDTGVEYVVLGETHSYNLDIITRGIQLIADGAHFIATNPDAAFPRDAGMTPACGAMAALMEKASGVPAFFIGKPNPLMMRTALNHLDVHSENTVMVGDNMATDIIGGVQAGMETILVLSGVTSRATVARYAYQPSHIVDSVANLPLA